MDGASGGGPRGVVDPEGLLRSALEKIVFFECRVSQLESEVAAANEGAERARAEAAEAGRRALRLEQAAAGEKAARGGADRRASELHDRVRLLEAERERLLGGLVDRARVAGAAGESGEPDGDDGGADLAGFIAELRAEIETLRAFRAEAEAAGYGVARAAASADGAASEAAPALAGRALAPETVFARAPPAPAAGTAAAPLAHAPRATGADPCGGNGHAEGPVSRAVPAHALAPAARAAGAPAHHVLASGTRAAETDPGRGSGRTLRSPDTLATLATRFEQAGRVGFTARDADRLKAQLATRADRALYDRSTGDLGAPDPLRRARAVRALEALGSRAAAPLMAAALGREEDPEVKVALLAALARLGEPSVADLAARSLADPRPAVRVAALEALAVTSARPPVDALAGALSDGSPLVRRRAALLLGLQAGARAEEALAVALTDADRGVARAAAAALSGRPSAGAQGALARGLEHPDPSVRRAAGLALSRVAGEPLDADATASTRRADSRRIAARLAAMDGEELRAAVLRSAATAKETARRVIAATAAVAPSPAPSAAAPAAAARGEGEIAHASRARTAVAVLAAPAPAAAAEGAPELGARIVGEIRAALRGCTTEALAGALGEPAEQIEAALGTLLASGAVARRGARWFMS